MNKTVKTIIHGHFYQPPREDPWTNILNDQESAYPFKNWNERISRECYGPNCYSRVLDKDGKITDIINNYKYMSFNFGPTLLSYLEKEENEIYKLILDADKYSVLHHGGHGNAIAQVYNHVILPLQTDEDKRTQIIWGLKDFEARFGRKSEGIWLSETAVDYATVDLLIEYGIKFTILSPNQAESYRKLGDEAWIKNAEHPIKPSKAYKIKRDKGDLAVFYFDKALSTAVSFEHLLHNSDNYANAILHSRFVSEDDDAVIIASDGEVYGHHEPFADMCLASLIKNYHIKNKKIEFMNFGEYLEKYPPVYETQLYCGEDGKGSSWSCFHGVGRWYRDCGCQTGGRSGWNQKWRTPLRESFDKIKKEIDNIYNEELKEKIKSPQELRNGYIDFLLSDGNIQDKEFIAGYKQFELSDDDISRILILLESQKYSMFMYTSCGWFFSELSGIETVQNIRYAYKAIELLGEKGDSINKEFESSMEKASSNIAEFRNGKWILDNWIYPEVTDFDHIAHNFITMLAANMDDIGDFDLLRHFGYEDFKISGINDKYSHGRISVYSLITRKPEKFSFLICEEKPGAFKNFISKNIFLFDHPDTGFVCGDYENNPEVRIFKQHDLLEQLKEKYIEKTNADDIRQVLAMNIGQINRIKELLFKYHNMKTRIPAYLKNLFKNSAETYFHYITGKFKDFPSYETYSDLMKIFEISKMLHIKLDTFMLKTGLSSLLYKNISGSQDPFSDLCESAIKMLNFSYKAGLIIEKSRCENIIFDYLKNKSPGIIKKIDESVDEEEKMKNLLAFRKILALSELFNINVEEEKRLFFKYF